jgi:hypothetical protein
MIELLLDAFGWSLVYDGQVVGPRRKDKKQL